MRSQIDRVIRRRINIILLFFSLMSFAIVVRLFLLQIVYHQEYINLASKQHNVVKDVFSERGAIFAKDNRKDLTPLALNKTYKTVVAIPKNIQNPAEAAKLISTILGLEIEEVFEKISKKDDPYEILAKKVDQADAEKLEGLKISGIALEEEKRRIYPHETLGAHIIGFVSKEEEEEKGRYGLEKFYNGDLEGERGFWAGAKDASGFLIFLGRRIVRPPQNGSQLILNVDYNIQLKAEEILRRTKEKWKALSGIILVLDPKTGKILALSASPSFDPNEFSKEKNFSVFLDPAVEAMYELGSVVKPITMAAGIEERKVSATSTYEDSGKIVIGGHTIQNFDGRSYKTQTMTQVLEKSLNTGAVHIANLLGKEKQLEYLRRFGFGEKTGIDLPGEIAGDISHLKNRRDIDFATASFGQGIAITPIQLAMAISAVANEGKMMRPYVVEKIIDDSGNESVRQPEVMRQVVSKETAEAITKMLVSAVRRGFENRAGVKGYFVAGKTGTAQIPRQDGRGYSDKVIHSFVGYAPAFNPRFLILLQLNEPQGNRFAANTLTPAFHDLAEYILNYYEVPPDER